ncbi:cysteine and histidine-rich protein 1 homolog [Caerostris darwini]|uniref:Cysteine and histidine-rich protein 1 homolog n=1 Tax=Caerostris darwini TaxID=1538125 RepID=A0AAV4X713_9ARAC|nr:cysteine and histidine-rich protein 1 homolog [Caerostris darwini]
MSESGHSDEQFIQSCMNIDDENVSPKKEHTSSHKMSKKKIKTPLLNKLRPILCCAVCSEIRRTAVYQCKYGHLICAGCFGDILSESRLLNEIASCPVCQTTISKELCSRNIAVEKTISELPMTCPYCSCTILPENIKNHKKCICIKRPSVCSNNRIGCSWEGPFCEKHNHLVECKQPLANGFDILQSLNRMDDIAQRETDLYGKIFDLLSVEKFSYHDLQFKHSESCDTEEEKIIYETSKFSAFDNLWLIRGYFKETRSELHFQLILKSKTDKRHNVQYFLVKGPYSEMEIKPQLCQFVFEDDSLESPFETLSMENLMSDLIFVCFTVLDNPV